MLRCCKGDLLLSILYTYFFDNLNSDKSHVFVLSSNIVMEKGMNPSEGCHRRYAEETDAVGV